MQKHKQPAAARIRRSARSILQSAIDSLEPRRLLSTTIVVNTFNDQTDSTSSSTISLRDALTRASTTSGGATVEAPGGSYALTLGQLQISSTSGTVLVEPVSGTPIVSISSGGMPGRLLQVGTSATVVISGFEFTGNNPTANANGGAIDNAGNLTLNGTSVTGNTLQPDDTSNGAGIYNSGTMNLADSTVENNKSAYDTDSGGGEGGGIYNTNTLIVQASTINGNDSYYDGGGIHNSGDLTMVNSTVAGNEGYYDGGGISGGTITLTNCTVADNEVDGDLPNELTQGGGIADTSGLTLGNTIVAGNTIYSGNGGHTGGPDVSGKVTSKDNNLIGIVDSYSSGWTASDYTGSTSEPLNAELGALGSNGGPTATLLPQSGSPAIDHGSNALIPTGVTTDQRGDPRISNGTVDIGSVEVQVAPAGGSISGTVTGGPAGETIYLDANNNSTLDSGELSTTTAANGAYGFTKVPAGNYIIRQQLPKGYTQTSPANGYGIHIAVTNGSSLTNENFTDAIVATGGSVSGTVNSNNGGLANIKIYLDANNNSTLDSGELSTTTASNGTYSFTNVPAGAFIIRQQLPSGVTQITPADNYGIHITVTNGGSLTNENFTDKVAATTGGSVSGTVKSTSGTALSGITVYLDANNNSTLDSGELSTTTNAAGQYTFTNVPPGAYIIRQKLPAGVTQTSPSDNYGIHITVTANGSLTNENFTDSVPANTASIAGTVFNDTNSDGAQDDGETGLSGWTVYLDLDNTGAFVAGDPTATTNSSGQYLFSDLAAGNYIVRVEEPSGYFQTSPANNLGHHITLAAGQSDTGVSFGQHHTG